MWVRRDNALQAIIAAQVFAKAQTIIAQRRHRLTDQEALDQLRKLWRERGYLTHKIIVAAEDVPDTSTYTKRFGSLSAAYRLIGFRPKARYCWAETETSIRAIVDAAFSGIAMMIGRFGGTATFDRENRLLVLDRVSSAPLEILRAPR
jgi:hypothetical protein